MIYFKFKRCFNCLDIAISLTKRNEVATQLLSRDKSFNTNAKKSCLGITNWVAIAQVS